MSPQSLVTNYRYPSTISAMVSISHFLYPVLICLCFSHGAVAKYKRASTNTVHASVYKTAPQNVSQAVLDSIHTNRTARLAGPKQSIAPKVPLGSPNSVGKHANVTTEEIQSARALVAAAHQSQAAYNIYQANNARRNTYVTRQSEAAKKLKEKRAQNAVSQPIHSNETIAAIRLIGDLDALAASQAGTLLKPYHVLNETSYSRPGGKFGGQTNPIDRRTNNDHFWLPNIQPAGGTQPYGGDDSYVVYRSVADYGAYGDGVTDDTDAINAAIADGNRCGANCLSSSVKAAVIYFPEGTYRISSPIIMYYNTQLVGSIDPTFGFVPTIMASSTFTGLGVFSSDIYNPGGQTEWYINQSNFYRQVRNFNFDLTEATLDGIAGIHWQVAQATSIQNVNFNMTDKSTSTQIGIFGENGSGGFMSDLTFNNGLYGILAGNQQFTVNRAWFYSCANAIGMIWDWGWTWSDLHAISCDIGINLVAPGSSAGDPEGSVYLMDSDFVDVPTVIYTFPWQSTEQATTVITLDNIQMIGVEQVFAFTNGYVSTIDTTVPIDFITIGDIEVDGSFFGAYGVNVGTRPAALTSDSVGFTFAQVGYFSRPKPSYYQEAYTSFFNAKWYCAGDGVTDDTYWIQAILDYCASQDDCILYFPAGSYVITSTILIPVGSFIVGEAWAQIVASGPNFADASRPTLAISIGNSGDVGVIEMQDLLFTSIGALPGLVLVEWNVSPSAQGSVAMWDCHFRLGGALGTDLQVSNCPIKSGGINPDCVAAFMLMLIPEGGSGYFENVWLWVADHDLDDPQNTQVDVYGGRGLMIWSDGPTWLWGTASEHSTLYQYQMYNSSNVFVGMIQTESPYYQGSATTQAPLPFDQILSFVGDPEWDTCGSATTSCNVAWALMIQNSQEIYVHGAGLYSWFQDYDEDCVNTQNCQSKLVYIYNTGDSFLSHIITIGAVQMLTPAVSNEYNEIVFAIPNTQSTGYPWWSTVAIYLDAFNYITDLSTWPHVVRNGWVSFGDSFAAGIGAGEPYDDDTEKCRRGNNSYTGWLDNIFYFENYRIRTKWQFLACSGAVANDLLAPGDQIATWDPSTSDIATLSILGNDLTFGNIVETCIVGYSKNPDCLTVVNNAYSLIAEGNTYLDDLLRKVWIEIFAKAVQPRFIIYQTGYPQFFENLDTICDNVQFYVGPLFWRYYGEPMTGNLRDSLNGLSTALNNKISSLVAQWNANLDFPQIVFVNVDQLTNPSAYIGHRFCEPDVQEVQADNDQFTVAVFYPNAGPDYFPEGQYAVSDWGPITIDSATCESESFADWTGSMMCDLAVAATTNSSILAAIEQNATGDDVIVGYSANNGDVLIQVLPIYYARMLHPKSFYHLEIAVQVTNHLVSN